MYGAEAKVCQETLENRISRVMKNVKADKDLLDSLAATTDLYGMHYIREMKAETMYAMTALQYRRGKKELKGLFKEQKKQEKQKK